MGTLFTLIVVLAILLNTIPAVVKQWRQDRAGFIKTLKIIGIYILYVAAGITFGILLAPEPGPGNETAGLVFTGFVVGWIFYGGLWLVRLVPRYREVPRWLDRPGVLDVIFLVATGACLAWLAL